MKKQLKIFNVVSTSSLPISVKVEPAYNSTHDEAGAYYTQGNNHNNSNSLRGGFHDEAGAYYTGVSNNNSFRGGFQRGKRRFNNNRGYYSNRGFSQPARGAYNSQFHSNRGSTQSMRGAYNSSQSNLQNQSHNFKSTRRLNPVNYNGEISLCSVCGSKFHWVRNCPDNVNAHGLFTECE